MGGVGKTTIAKEIYNEIGRNFEGRSFLANINEVWEHDNGSISLQQKLLSDIYITTKMKIGSTELGISILEKRLHQKRILLILDDVSNSNQLEALCGSRAWFRPGSRIFITTRDRRILRSLKVDYVFEMDFLKLNDNEALELFSWHAFKQSSPKEDLTTFSREVVSYSGNLPLALKVLGCILFTTEVSKWKSALERLRMIPDDDVQKKLKVGFDGLDDLGQNIFLDICCFFIGRDRYVVTNLMDGCGFFGEIGISNLIERSLVTVDRKNKLRMHDLLRDMGREIIREKSPSMIEMRTRLWYYDEVLEVLQQHTGTNFVEGLALMRQRGDSIRLNAKTFEKMKRLRLLQLGYVDLEGDYKCVSQNLKWLSWHGYPRRNMPSQFPQESLVVIELRYSSLRSVWQNPQMLEKLKVLNLSHSHSLEQTPKFSNLPNLERLILKDCSKLSVVHHTVGDLKKLVLLNLKDCKTLSSLPRSIYKLKSLETLILAGCSNIEKLDEDLEQMESLRTLIADNTGITKVPFSIARSKSVGYISLCGYKGSSHDVLPSVIWSWMSPKTNPLSLQPYESLSIVDLSNMQSSSSSDLSLVINEVPKLQGLCFNCRSYFELDEALDKTLKTLYDANCMQRQALPSITQTSASGTETQTSAENSLGYHLIQMGKNDQVSRTLAESIPQNFRSGSDDSCLPGDKLPDWRTFSGEGPSVTFQVPEVSDCNLRKMAVCLLYLSSDGSIAPEQVSNVLIINYTKATIQVYKLDKLTSLEEEDCESYISNLEVGDKVEIMVVSGDGLILKKTAVYLFYASNKGFPNFFRRCFGI